MKVIGDLVGGARSERLANSTKNSIIEQSHYYMLYVSR